MKNLSVMLQAGKPQSGCSQNSAGRGQILTVLQVNSYSIDQKNDKIWTGQADLQPISFKSDRLLGIDAMCGCQDQLIKLGFAHQTAGSDDFSDRFAAGGRFLGYFRSAGITDARVQ